MPASPNPYVRNEKLRWRIQNEKGTPSSLNLSVFEPLRRRVSEDTRIKSGSTAVDAALDLGSLAALSLPFYKYISVALALCKESDHVQ